MAQSKVTVSIDNLKLKLSSINKRFDNIKLSLQQYGDSTDNARKFLTEHLENMLSPKDKTGLFSSSRRYTSSKKNKSDGSEELCRSLVSPESIADR